MNQGQIHFKLIHFVTCT